jgi:diguanylate cyclase (GGDEF)-like protein
LVRDADVFVRRGGDEFVLIMPHTDEQQALTVAQRIRGGVAAQPLDAGGQALRRTLSMGVATWNGQEGAKELELRADRALYEAKDRGRNRVVLARPVVEDAAAGGDSSEDQELSEEGC